MNECISKTYKPKHIFHPKFNKNINSMNSKATFGSPSSLQAAEFSTGSSPEGVKNEIKLEVETPPNTQVYSNEATRFETNREKTIYQLFFPENIKTAKIYIQGAFGGKIVRELKFENHSPPTLKISETVISDSSNSLQPEQMKTLPELCPRMLSKKSNLIPPFLSFRRPWSPEEAIYEGTLDFLINPVTDHTNNLYLETARMKFDYEDPTIFVGYNHQTGKTSYEENGGFYSNIHFFILPYQSGLETLYQSMENDLVSLRKLERELLTLSENDSRKIEIEQQIKIHYDKLYGVGNSLGPYQILMHLVFGSLQNFHWEELQHFSSPANHGFIPGPFRGSSHWGYTLCEWGDTFYHTTEQKMNYANFPLWHWTNSSLNEKIILVVIEGDDQLRKNPDRLKLEQKGILRSFDYSDDLIGFFVIHRNETLKHGKILSSPLEDFILQVRTN